jgi:hypothetical protein
MSDEPWTRVGCTAGEALIPPMTFTGPACRNIDDAYKDTSKHAYHVDFKYLDDRGTMAVNCNDGATLNSGSSAENAVNGGVMVELFGKADHGNMYVDHATCQPLVPNAFASTATPLSLDTSVPYEAATCQHGFANAAYYKGDDASGKGHGSWSTCQPLRQLQTDLVAKLAVNYGWSEWSTCSAKCDGGIQTRKKQVIQPARGSGGTFTGEVEQRACNPQACVNKCTASPWTPWSACSRPCGGGEQSRSRTVSGGDADDVDTCFFRDASGTKHRFQMSNMHQTQLCNTQVCVGPGGCKCSAPECPWRAVPGRPLNGDYGSVNGKYAIKSSAPGPVNDSFRAEWQSQGNTDASCKQLCDQAGGNMVVMMDLASGQRSCNCYKNDECLKWNHDGSSGWTTYLKDDSYPCDGGDDNCHRTS